MEIREATYDEINRVVTDQNTKGQYRVCAEYTSIDEIDINEVKKALRNYFDQYTVEIFVKTSPNGKKAKVVVMNTQDSDSMGRNVLKGMEDNIRRARDSIKCRDVQILNSGDSALRDSPF